MSKILENIEKNVEVQTWTLTYYMKKIEKYFFQLPTVQKYKLKLK